MSEFDEKKPIGEVLNNIQIGKVPDGWTPLDAFVVVKCIDDEGSPNWFFRTTDGINEEELLGAMSVQTALLRRGLVAAWEEDDDDGDDD